MALVQLLTIAQTSGAASIPESCVNHYTDKLILAVGSDITMGVTSGDMTHPYATFLETKLPQMAVRLIGSPLDRSRVTHDVLSEVYTGWPLFTTLPSVVVILTGELDATEPHGIPVYPAETLRMIESMHIMTHRFAQSKRIEIKTIAVTIPTEASNAKFVNHGLRKFAANDHIKQHGRVYGIKEFTSVLDLSTDIEFAPLHGDENMMLTDDYEHLSIAGHDHLGALVLEELCRLTSLTGS